MRKYASVLIALLCCCCIAFADAGTVANKPVNALQSPDQLYVQQQKDLGTLKMDDPAYLRLLSQMKQSAAPHHGNPLDQGNDNCPAVIIPGIPYSDNGSTFGLTNDFTCSGNSSGDVVYEYVATMSATLRAQTCGGVTNYDTRLEVRAGTCPGADYLCNDDFCGLQSTIDFPVNPGDIVTIVVDGFSSTFSEGDYTLSLDVVQMGRCCYAGSCFDFYLEQDCLNLGGQWGGVNTTCASDPCPPLLGALRVVNVPVPCPSGIGVSISADCRGDLYYTCYGGGILYRMDEFGNLLDQHTIQDAAGNTILIDEFGWDEGRQLFWGGEFSTHGIWTIDRTGLATFQFTGQVLNGLTDGCDYDGTDGTIWHSEDSGPEIAHFTAAGLFLGNLTLYDEIGNPEVSISGVEMGANNTLWAGHSAIDDVRRCNKTTGAFISRFDAGQVRCEGMECDAINFAPLVALWVKDAYNNTVTAFEIDSGSCVCAELPDTCIFTYQEIDDGDLPPCNYPTFHGNPGHGLSGIAWLGACVTGEPAPNVLDLDPCDDGVLYIGLPWTPCTLVDVRVIVSAGPEYGRFAECGGHLYLNGWKDGNYDGDFCDEIPCGPAVASEWIVRDELVVPGAWPFSFIDPGVLDIGVYDGIFRWRLTSTPVGRFGFGLAVAGACTDQCGTFAFDYLGEVEDYIVNDAQLNVELSSFDAIGRDGEVAVTWTTASETDNDHFEIVRNGATVAQIAATNSATGGSYNWVDHNVANGTSYTYALVAVDAGGAREELASESATPSMNVAVITEYALHQNYPNPFNPSTSITFDLLESGVTTVKVFDLMGREVATLVNGNVNAGRHTISFDASGLPSGVYLYKLNVNGFEAQDKMLLLK